jgi:ABC-2 type transport system permease protein
MNSLLIAKNIIKRVLKGPKEIITIIVMPVILVSVIVTALGKTASSVPKIGIVESDNGFYSTSMVDYIKKQNVEVVELSQENYESSLKQKKVSSIIVIPENFSSDIDNGKKVEIDFYANNNDAATQSLKQLVNQYMLRLYRAGETAKVISQETSENKTDILNKLISETEKEALKIQYSLLDKSNNVLNAGNSALGFAIMFMMILIFTTIGIILEDKKNLTLARMFVSPIREQEIILGNLLGSLVLGLMQLIPLTIVFKMAFKIDSLYKLAGIFIIFFCFLIAVIGIGIGISGFIKQSMNPATLIATVITPTSILGGCFMPESMLPDFINKIGYAVPQKWVMRAVQSILTGESFNAIILNLVIILMFGLAFATFGLKTLRPINDV